MTHALNLDKNNRVLSTTFDEYAPAEYPRVNALPDGDIRNYLYINGEFVYDPLPVEEVDPKPTQLDIIESQVVYTAMMTDTLLEV